MSKSQRLASIFREIELQQGDASESYFEGVLTRARDDGCLPSWIHDWKHHQKWSSEDRQGIDFTIHTDRGNIYINVKSSYSLVKLFQARHIPGKIMILPISVNILKDEMSVLCHIINIISKEYKSM